MVARHDQSVQSLAWSALPPVHGHDSGPSVISTGCEGGEIRLTSRSAQGSYEALATWRVSGEGRAPGCSALAHSRLEPSGLASGLSTGDVQIWDALEASKGGRVPLHTFSEHTGACTGLAWSAVNRLLLTSVGLDGLLAFYDSSQRTTVKVVDVGQALRCVAFHEDGCSIAAGGGDGCVRLFDLRMSLRPSHVLTAARQGGPVHSVCFQSANASCPAGLLAGLHGQGANDATTIDAEAAAAAATAERRPFSASVQTLRTPRAKAGAGDAKGPISGRGKETTTTPWLGGEGQRSPLRVSPTALLPSDVAIVTALEEETARMRSLSRSEANRHAPAPPEQERSEEGHTSAPTRGAAKPKPAPAARELARPAVVHRGTQVRTVNGGRPPQ